MQRSNCVAIVNQFKVFLFFGGGGGLVGDPKTAGDPESGQETGTDFGGYPSIVVHLSKLLGAGSPTF